MSADVPNTVIPKLVIPSLVIIEDDRHLADALAEGLSANWQIERVLYDYASAARHLPVSSADVVLLDLKLGEYWTSDLIPKVSSRMKVVVHSVHGDEARVVQAICDGAVGYLVKGERIAQLDQNLCSVMLGNAPLSPSVAAHILRHLREAGRAGVSEVPDPVEADSKRTDSSDDQLTLREEQVLRCLARGLSYSEAAIEFDISVNTVAFHTKNIYEKMHVNSRGEAVYRAVNRGMLGPEL